jgi:hypothetical protein
MWGLWAFLSHYDHQCACFMFCVLGPGLCVVDVQPFKECLGCAHEVLDK